MFKAITLRLGQQGRQLLWQDSYFKLKIKRKHSHLKGVLFITVELLISTRAALHHAGHYAMHEDLIILSFGISRRPQVTVENDLYVNLGISCLQETTTNCWLVFTRFTSNRVLNKSYRSHLFPKRPVFRVQTMESGCCLPSAFDDELCVLHEHHSYSRGENLGETTE
jgi:hypothetical protein